MTAEQMIGWTPEQVGSETGTDWTPETDARPMGTDWTPEADNEGSDD